MKYASLFRTTFCLFFFTTFTLGLFAQAEMYHLIVGSYVTFGQANQKIKSIAPKGYDAVIIFPNDKAKRYRVSIYRSKKQNEVQAYQAMLKREGVEKSWIYLEEPPKPKEKKTETVLNPAPFDERSLSPTKDKEAAEENSDLTYYLVAGSFNDLESANIYANELVEESFETTILYPDAANNKYKVSIYYTENRAEIDAYATYLRRQGKVKGWIYNQHRLDGTRAVAPSKLAPAIPAGNMFYLIRGSYKSHIAATDFAAKMRKEGHQPMILLPSPNDVSRYRVAIYRADVRADVAAYQQKIKNQGKEAGWIFQQ